MSHTLHFVLNLDPDQMSHRWQAIFEHLKHKITIIVIQLIKSLLYTYRTHLNPYLSYLPVYRYAGHLYNPRSQEHASSHKNIHLQLYRFSCKSRFFLLVLRLPIFRLLFIPRLLLFSLQSLPDLENGTLDFNGNARRAEDFSQFFSIFGLEQQPLSAVGAVEFFRC